VAGPCVVIPNYNGEKVLGRCLASLHSGGRPHCPIVVVDNASRDGSAALVRKKFPKVKLLRMPRNLGFGTALNRGAAAAPRGCDSFLFLNNDAWLERGALKALLAALKARPQAAVIGALVLRGDGDVVDSAGGAALFLPFGIFGGLHGNRPWSQAPQAWKKGPFEAFYSDACAMLVRRKAFQAVGGFEERYFMYFEEIDFCWRLRQAGGSVFCAPQARVRHVKGSTPKPRELSLKILGAMEHNLLAMAWKLYPGASGLLLFGVTLLSRFAMSLGYALISPAVTWAKWKGMAAFFAEWRGVWRPERWRLAPLREPLGWKVFESNPFPPSSPLRLLALAGAHFLDIGSWYRRGGAASRPKADPS
jgi:N-acetylglucosaminyl-diphospho-decaprenol L-rhamnosyltransferase